MLIALTNFILVWLGLSFIINNAPTYYRMLIAVPFVVALAAFGINHSIACIGPLFNKHRLIIERSLLILVTVLIIALNTVEIIRYASVNRGEPIYELVSNINELKKTPKYIYTPDNSQRQLTKNDWQKIEMSLFMPPNNNQYPRFHEYFEYTWSLVGSLPSGSFLGLFLSLIHI